jgi:hypothetical protein
MTLEQIQQAHLSGLTVCWANIGYQIKGRDPDNLVVCCIHNNYCIGLSEGHAAECFILTEPMTPAEQADYDAAVASGSITPGTPVVPHACAERLCASHGIPNGRLESNIKIWIDDTKGGSVAVAFAPPHPGPGDVSHETMPYGSTHRFHRSIRVF